MHKPLLVTAITATFALGAPAYADHHKGSADSGRQKTQMQPEKGAGYGADAAAYEFGFTEMDRNRDGYLTREEAREHATLDDNWDKADANRDGRLSESEFSAFEDSDADTAPSDR